MVTANAIGQPLAPALTALSSWSLPVGEREELLIVTGHGDVDSAFRTGHPGDPLGQMRAILDELAGLLERVGYRRDTVILAVLTVAQDFDLAARFDALVGFWSEYFAGVALERSGGNFRTVEALATPGKLVEIELLAAR